MRSTEHATPGPPRCHNLEGSIVLDGMANDNREPTVKKHLEI